MDRMSTMLKYSNSLRLNLRESWRVVCVLALDSKCAGVDVWTVCECVCARVQRGVGGGAHGEVVNGGVRREAGA